MIILKMVFPVLLWWVVVIALCYWRDVKMAACAVCDGDK